jgi:hypothetical protein
MTWSYVNRFYQHYLRFIDDMLCAACVAIVVLCGIVPGVPGGCDPPQPASNAAVAPMLSAERTKIPMCDA